MSVKRDRRERRWLLTGIVLVLLFAVGYIAWSSVLLRERQLEVAELVLERNQQMLHVRLDGMMQQREQDLMEECTALDPRVNNIPGNCFIWLTPSSSVVECKLTLA